MGNNKGWLKARERHRILIAEIKRIAGGSFIAALIVGPLIYFSVVAMPLDMRTEQAALDRAATPDVDIAAETEVKTSVTPLPTPTVDPRTAKIIAKSRIKDLKLSPSAEKFAIEVSEPVIATAGDLFEEREIKFESFFGEQDAKIKEITLPEKALENRMLVIEDIIVDEGPAKIDKRDDAEKVAEKALQQYLKSEFKIADFRVFKDTSILDKNKKTYQFVLGDIKRNNGKWYVTYNQYSSALPVFDGNIKFIFTEGKKLLVISDNIKRDLPAETEFKIGKAVVEQNVKQIFEWDDTLDKIEFIDKGYFKGAPAYRAHTNAHNPAGNWEIFVEGVEGKVEDMKADIRLQDEPATPEPEPSIEPEIEVTEEETPTETPTETPEEPQPTVEVEPTVEPETPVQPEPEIVILDIIFSQILGKIYPQTPSDDPATEPLAHSYAYIDETRITTDKDGYFENPSMAWYSTFLDGPYVTVRDDDATSNIEIVNQTPAVPFLWDENSASLAAINAFYHTNKIRDYFAENHGYEINKNVPLTVNSKLVDAYINGCGAWFNNSQKTIEMGRGGTEDCPTELNYALGSDFVYHEYAHFVVEEVTHLPYILGSETAAMSEGLSDYFAATINNDSVWGDVIAPSRQRNLENTLNYNTDRTGSQHRDGMIFSGALWDLRKEIGAEATDALVFNTLFQDRYSFETFMYGMIIEDDDNGDFSDGTPHLAEIITAFENHGIGPGIAGFNGLPLTPEAWAELLGEEIPEGEEEELLGAHSGNCTITGVSPNYTLTVPASGTCNVTSSETYDYITLNSGANLIIGNTSSSNTILRANSNVLVQGGTIYVGSTTSATVDAKLEVGGDLSIYTDGIAGYVYTRSATGTGVENYITVGGTLNVGTNTGNLGYLNINDANTLNTAATTYVYGDVTISSGAKLDTAGYTYIYGSAADFTVNSGGDYETGYMQNGDNSATPAGGDVLNSGDIVVINTTDIHTSTGRIYNYSGSTYNTNYLYMGESDGTPTGGTLSNAGTMTVDYSTYLYTGTSFTNTNSYSNAYYFRIGHNATATNSGTLNQTNASYYMDMTDDCTFTNTGIVSIAGTFAMDQVSYTAEANRPILNNNNGANNFYVAKTITLSDYAELNNGTNGSTSGAIETDDDLVLNNYAKITNGVSGTGAWGVIRIRDDLTLYNNSRLTNYYYVYVGYSESDGTTTTRTHIDDSAKVINGDSSSYFYNYNSGASTYGILTLYDLNAEFQNYGYAYFRRVKIGDQGTGIDGGTLNNESGGRLYVYETSLSESTPALDLFRGKIYNKSGATAFDIDGLAYIWGDASGTGTITFSSTITAYIAQLKTYNYSLIQVDAGTLNIDGNGTAANGNLTTTGTGAVGVGVNGTLTVQNEFMMRDSSTAENYGIVNVYDDLFLTGETSCSAEYDNKSGATTTVSGTTDNELWVYWTANVINAGTFNVDYAAGSQTDGRVRVYADATLSNTGTFRASRVYLGDVSAASPGGTITNNSGGKIEVSASTSALDIYRATLNNCASSCASPSTTLVDMVNDGYVQIKGVSGDRGYLDNYGTVEGKFQIEDYGSLLIRNGGLYTATLGNVYGDNTTGTNDGTVEVYSGGELNVTTLNIGSTSTSINSGIVRNDGKIQGTTLNIYEDATYPDNDYELTNNIFGTATSALISFNTINLGTIVVDGGEIYNRGGDGSPFPTDTTDDGIIAGQTNIYGGGRIYNGRGRTGSETANLNAEYNYELATSTKWTMDLYDGSLFENYGYVGGAIDTESPIILASPVAVRYDAQTANFSVSQVVTGATSGATGTINSMYDLGTYGTLGLTSVSGTFLDNETVTSATGSATVNMEKTFINKSGGDVETRDILMKHSGFYNNYGATTSTTVAISGRRGTMNLASPGSLTVTGTTGKDLSVAIGGTLNAFNGNTSLTAESVSIINDTVSTDVSNLHIYSNSGTIEFDTVSVGELGSFNVNGNSPTITSDLSMEGTSGSRQGKVVIADTTDDARLTVEGKTAINSYGVLENNAIVGLTGWGFRGYDIVAVKSGGTITSDTTSDFNFGNGIASAGTVLLADNMEATNNSTSTYAIEVTGGTFAMGTSSNTGTSYTTVGSSSIGNVMVTGGTFTTYNNAKFDNVTVTGSGSVANFEDSTSPTTCKSDIHGYFDILAGATAEINCSNTVDPAVYVHSGSPGGNTQVEGTLILNTNLTTETMVVGRLSTSGTVTHDSMTGSDDPTTTFVLTVSDTLTINTNGSLDVTGKANYRCSTGSGTRGGTYGGRGQYNGSTGSASTEYGNVTSWLEHFGCGGTSGEENFWGRGGGIMNIYVGSVGNGSLINNGSILANGMAFSGIYSKGGGSGGSINIAAFNTVSGSGPIAANGGSTSASPDSAGGGGKIVFAAYDKSAYTGSVSARGGQGGIGTNYAGTGTIFYGSLDVWQNHNDGTLVIDGFSATGNIDVDLDSTTITSDAADDATKITADTVDVESVQLDRYGALYFFVPTGGVPMSVIQMQQCIASNSGFLTLGGYARATYNRDTTPVLRQACIETSDPPATLYINDSTTGAQSNFPGYKTDPIPSFADLTPATSALYKEAALDRTGTAEGNGYDAFGYEILIGTSAGNVYNDIAIGTSDECNFSGTMPNIGHNSRSDDILVPSACGNYLTVNTPYYWKIRFMEDLDFDLDTTDDQYWGLWSPTNHFEIDEGGILTFDSCATGITQFSLGPFNTVAGDNFDYDYCTFDTEATVETYVQVNKDGPLTHTDTVDPGGEIRDMGTLDYDSTSGLDGRNAAGSLEINELGFYLDNINTAEFTVEASGTTFQLFTDYYHYLPDIATTIFSSSGGYSNESFDINIGAFVHGLINAAEPTASYPTSRCSTAQGAPCITRPGDYIAEFTITLTLNP